MMKFQTAIALGLATFLVVPTVALGVDEIGTLEDALANTARALEVLAGIEKKLQSDAPVSTGVVLAVTEPPMLDARRRDERLNALRNECSLLQTELDLLAGVGAMTVPVEDPIGMVTSTPVVGDANPLPPVHTGLDPATRNVLRSLSDGDSDESRPRDASSAADVAGSETEGEPEGYSADPVGQARACYRAGRYAQGLALLEDVAGDTQALYWRARCLEKLDRLDEAAEDLKRVIEKATDGFERKRAETDLEYIEWKKGFLEKLGDRAGSTGNGG